MRNRTFSFFLLTIFSLFISTMTFAQQQNTETGAINEMMRSNGKINVVIGVLVIIFVGIVLYLVRIERKLHKLEQEK
ncbi:CcmD family protein [Chitinophaga sedimenti]|uniref:CcmD family protein n=1 Tax=Chitinophaga sedimenti TaxID=2033606 RepID=UPI0020055AA6|nr:CcmD family protein [Chitinophaga sedimenti]MCK7559762.1 CcmD family protein [Chitinophaga sedimenti]